MKWPVCTWLLFIFNQSQAAPKNAAMDRLDLANDFEQESFGNPLLFGEDKLKVLQNYLKTTDKFDRDPEGMMRDQVLLYLFAMYDFDKSGRLDGLELLKLIGDIVSQNIKRPPSPDSVSPIVDEVLDKQDVNQDGLLDHSELLNPPSNASLAQPLEQVHQKEDLAVVLQPPHGAHQQEVNDSVLQQVDQSVPASEGGLVLDQKGADVIQSPEEHVNNDSQNPLIEEEEEEEEEEEPATEEHLPVDAQDNEQYEEDEVAVEVGIKVEPHLNKVIADHEM